MKNIGKVLKTFILFTMLILLVIVISLLYKNRAASGDYINYLCFLAVVLFAIIGGSAFGLLMSLVVVFGYTSFLIIFSMAQETPFVLHMEHFLWIGTFIFSAFVFGAVGNKLRFVQHFFHEYRNEIDDLIELGQISILGNIHRFEIDLEYELSRAKRSKSDLLIIYLRLDGLKEVSKKFGKLGAEKLIKEIGSVVLRVTRTSDKKAKIDELTHAIILPETGIDNAEIVIKKLAIGVKKIFIEHRGERVSFVPTIKYGFANFPKDGDSLAALKLTAEKRLKRYAKL